MTVVIPVYNTMPYLRQCLDSVLSQSIGLDRLQIVAVDDGSTDGGAELLDELAERHPTTLVVIHQPNSGGPAAPCNRGLEHATGRWVFFLGADDYLAPTALARLVTQGDDWDSDVIFGTMRGENGRFVDQRIYRRTATEVTFDDPALAYSLSNTKLFRRALLERHAIRYALDLRVGSDQPFVVEALIHARRVSVLADQVYYHAVRRDDSTNISYSSGWRTRLSDLSAIIRHIAAVTDPGPVRDAILTRHFTMELGKLVRLDLLALPEVEQAQLLAGLRELVADFWTDGLRDRMGVLARLRVELAASDQVELLRRVVDYHAAAPLGPPLILQGGTGYVWYPGFDTPETDRHWYAVHRENLIKRLSGSLQTIDVTLESGSLRVRGRIGVSADSSGQVRAALVALPAGQKPPAARRRLDPATAPLPIWFPVRLQPTGSGRPADFRADLTVPAATDAEQVYAVQIQVSLGDTRYDLPVSWRRRQEIVLGPVTRAVQVTARPAGSGALLLTTRPLSLRVAARSSLRRRRAAFARRLPPWPGRRRKTLER